MATNPASVVGTDWNYVLSLLPPDLDKLATETGAIRRRRSFTSAEQLLRVLLAYATGDWSFRQTAAMFPLWGGAEISDVAVLKRFRSSPAFLCALISALLARRLEDQPTLPAQIHIIDGSTVSEPGSHGADWRLHLSYDLGRQQLFDVELTTAAGGETLTRHEIQPNLVYVTDRGYGTAPGLHKVLDAQAQFITRITPQNVSLQTLEGEPVPLREWLSGLADATPGEIAVTLSDDSRPLRLIGLRKSPQATVRAQALARREAHGGQIRELTLFLAGYVLVLTNCQQYSTAEILQTYAFRWQIELAIKRLKSLVHLDQLRAHDPEIARAYLLAKILAALLVEELHRQAIFFSPWGFPLTSH